MALKAGSGIRQTVTFLVDRIHVGQLGRRVSSAVGSRTVEWAGKV